MFDNTLKQVVDCIAATTRYPTELLTPDAELENGLGIDSVKRVEIVVALGEKFGLDLMTQPGTPSARTIGDIATLIDGLLGKGGESKPPVQEVREVELPHVQADVISSEAIQASRPHSVPAPHYLENVRERESVREFDNVREEELAPAAKSLSGRVALVTGSGRGVGRTIARLLASRGATVIVNSFHSREQGEQTAAEINASGGRAVHIWGSVANSDHVEKMFSQIENQFGLDILVCNASDGRIGSFLDLTSDDWVRAFRTNVAGHHQCAVRAAELMRPRGGGSIITLSAVGAHQFIDGLGCQGVVKAAVESMTRYLACVLGPSGIRVNCVAGGPVYGDLLAKFPDARAAQSHWESMTPDGELCTPMDLAQTIGFLVSDEARGINGAVWMVDHGFSATAEGQLRHRVSRVSA
jgi:NAD(P)-dependent dehydrogenase (short-subunit alcohol dehydrogenase family)/acyl carrier protein